MTQITVRGLTGSEKGKEYHFTASSVLLGTGQHCDVSFNPQWDRTVDVSHARIVWLEGRLWVEDAGSRNGVFLDGRRIKREMLRSDAVIELGQNGPRLQIVSKDAEPGLPDPKASRAVIRRIVKPIGLGVVFWLVAKALIFLYFSSGLGDRDTKFQQVAEEHREAVGLVVVAFSGGSANIGTAWAVSEDAYATNAHVALAAQDAIDEGGNVFISVNERPDLRFRVVEMAVHPRFGIPLVNASGMSPELHPYDVALMRVEGRTPKHWKIAGRKKLEKLSSGFRVAFLGYPMEQLVGSGVNNESPVANMQSGIVTSNTDYWLSKTHYEERLLIGHNLPATGGASGSPVFDSDGEVVGVLFAVNMVASLNIDAETEQVEIIRTPNAAQLNFAQRSGLISEMLENW
jgi:V8-like Glu-specific endopeptidase